MAIYTRTGDKGTTGIFGGKRVSKASKQIEATGSVDELTAYLGLVVSLVKGRKSKILLTNIQKDLYKIMAVIAEAKIPIAYLSDRTIDFEREIDSITLKLPKLNSFILPGGSVTASHFHILRVLARRAERKVVSNEENAIIVAYLNRLSDLFFTLARQFANGKEQRVKL